MKSCFLADFRRPTAAATRPEAFARDRRVLHRASRRPRGRPDRWRSSAPTWSSSAAATPCGRVGRGRCRASPCRSSSASLVVATVGRLPLVVQETIEGIAAVIAVIVLTWMLFWMRRQGRAMKGELEHGVDMALAGGSVLALAGLAFVSVAREGLETVLFLFAIGTSSGPAVQTLVAAFAGLAAAVAIGVAIFAAGIRIDLRRVLQHHRDRADLRVGRAGRLRRPRVRRGRPDRQFGYGLRPRRDPARVEPARRAARRPVRLPLDADAARGHRLPGLPHPGPVVFLRPMRKVAVGPAAAATAMRHTGHGRRRLQRIRGQLAERDGALRRAGPRPPRV